MYNEQSIIMIVVFLIIMLAIVWRVLAKIKVSNIKVMLLGISLMAFSGSVLKGITGDVIISIIGFSFCIVGFFRSDK